jgi:hypothetical protein
MAGNAIRDKGKDRNDEHPDEGPLKFEADR